MYINKSAWISSLILLIILLRITIPSTTEILVLQKIELIVNVLMLILGVITSVLFLSKSVKVWLLGLSLVIYLWVMVSNSLAGGAFLQTTIEVSKYVVPVLLVVNLMELSYANKSINRKIHFIFIISLMFFIYPLIFKGSFTHGGIERLPLYYGTLHDNGYIAAIAGLYSLFVLHYSKRFLFAIPLLIFALYLMDGYAVRTAILMFCIAGLGIYINRFSGISRQNIYIFCGFILLSTIFLFISLYDDVDQFVRDVSSGRTLMWVEQGARFMNGSVVELVFGFGVNGDFIQSQVWAWEEKGAHSSVVSFLVRYGIGGGIIFSIFLYRLYFYFSKEFNCKECKWLFLSFISTLIVSNGLIERVVPFLLFLLLFVVIINLKKISLSHNRKYLVITENQNNHIL